MTSRTAPPPEPTVIALTVLASLVMLIPGAWAWLAPASFADATSWPPHEHFLRDAGVFQIAIGAMLLAALRWRDVLVVALGGFVLANTLHAFNHLQDLQLGGHSSDPIALGAFSLLAAIALALRLRQMRTRQTDLKDAP